MREIVLKKLANWHASHPWRMLLIVALVTIVLGGFAGQITVTMQTQDLLPEGDIKVDQFNIIVDEFASATSIVVVTQGKEDRIKAFADDLAPRVMELIDTTQNSINQKQIAKLTEKREKLIKGDKELVIAKLDSQIQYLSKRINFPLFLRVDYKVETDFLRNHALMLVKAEDLENTKELFMNPNLTELLSNLNNSMEKEYVGREESISTREKEDGAVNFLDGIQHFVLKLQKATRGDKIEKSEVQAAADEFLLGEPYFLSYDKSALILNVIPNFTIMDRDLLMVGVDNMQALVDDVLQDYPDVRAGLSGDIAREHDEQLHSQQSLGYTTIIAIVAIFILLVFSFRMWTAPILAIINLLVGLIWAFGAAFLAVEQLNMMTAMLSIVLLGLGIDFSIHLISGVTEWRAAGDSIAVALEKTFLKSGKGIITGALTTACAFLALLVSQSRGMKEMGIVTGLGLLSILLTTLVLLPVLLVFRERYIDRKRVKKGRIQKDISFRPLGHACQWLSKHYIFTIIASLIVSAFLIWSAFQIEYDQNMLRMEPKGLTSIALQDTIMEKFDLSMEYALCLADGVDESRELAEKYRDLNTVAMTNDISLYLPSKQEQEERTPHITEVQNQMESSRIKSAILPSELPAFTKEIERLEMNVMEMQDMAFLGGQDKVDNKCKEIVGDPEANPSGPNSRNIIEELRQLLESDNPKAAEGLSVFQRHFAPYFQQSVIRMCSTESIELEDLPVSVLDRYSNRARDKFMITIYPSGQLYADLRLLNRFVDDVDRVSEKTTGGPPVAIAWFRIAARDGRKAIMLTLVIVFILLWIDFHTKRYRWIVVSFFVLSLIFWALGVKLAAAIALGLMLITMLVTSYAIIAMIPLILGAFWMVGIMYLSGMMLSFMTLMGIPLIIGIGIDDGVHIMHRWRHEGNGKIMTVFSSTGKAILLTSLTTMLAFGSLVFSVFPAWAWFGESLFIGVGACFLTTIIILPGILGMIEKRAAMKNADTN